MSFPEAPQGSSAQCSIKFCLWVWMGCVSPWPWQRCLLIPHISLFPMAPPFYIHCGQILNFAFWKCFVRLGWIGIVRCSGWNGYSQLHGQALIQGPIGSYVQRSSWNTLETELGSEREIVALGKCVGSSASPMASRWTGGGGADGQGRLRANCTSLEAAGRIAIGGQDGTHWARSWRLTGLKSRVREVVL